MRNFVENNQMHIKKLAFGGSTEELGGKGYRIAELYRSGFAVPEGFILTTKAFDEFVNLNSIDKKETVKTDDLSLPSHINDLVCMFYRQIFGDTTVIVRSSATAEDSPNLSFAGIYKSMLDVTEISLKEAITYVYASLFSNQAKEYAKHQGVAWNAIKMAIIIQRQIEPLFSGVCFTANPVSGRSEFVIEFVHGRSEDLLAGKELPSRLIYNRNFQLTKTSISNRSSEKPHAQMLEVIGKLLSVCEKIEGHFGRPQDIEWAIDNDGDLYILQSRDITTITVRTHPIEREISASVLAHGLGVSEGIATGPACKVMSDLSVDEANSLIHPGDIAVTHTLRIDHLPALSKCAGIITADASLLSHTAIRARELGIPCVGGVTNALTIRDGQLLTIDGNNGVVYSGRSSAKEGGDSEVRLVYYNPERVKKITNMYQTILYERIDGTIAAYIERISDERLRAEAIRALSDSLKVDPATITIDEHGLWEGESSPSVVYDQYITIKHLRRRNDTAKLLYEGRKIALALDPDRLREFIDRVDAKAYGLFVRSINQWKQYKRSHKRKFVEEAAALLDQAKRYSGNLIGVAVLDVYATYALEKSIRWLREKYDITMQNIFAAATGLVDNKANPSREWRSMKAIGKRIGPADRKQLFRIVEYAKVMQEYKNKRLQVLTHDGLTALDLVDELYQGGAHDIVLKYQW